MLLSYAFCQPVKKAEVPSRPEWLHEIKYDGYRMMLIRSGRRVRLITRGGYDWTKRYPLIVETALKLKAQHFMIDGEAVVLNEHGVSDFDALVANRHDHEAQLYAFDVLAGQGDDYRSLPLISRKANLQRLLARAEIGIFVAPFEQGEIGPELFTAACRMGLEGIVSKHKARAYDAGPCRHWIKVKNREHPAYARVMEVEARRSRRDQRRRLQVSPHHPLP